MMQSQAGWSNEFLTIDRPQSTLRSDNGMIVMHLGPPMSASGSNFAAFDYITPNQYGLLCLLSLFSWTFNFFPPNWHPFIILMAD